MTGQLTRPEGQSCGNAAEKLRVLVACEYSAVVRDAFRVRGFDAWSCDLLPTEGDARWHIEGDAIEVAYGQHWDLMVAHPPCTHLAVSGARWFKDKLPEQAEALEFVRKLLCAPIAHIALENPVSIISSRIRKPDFTIQPWQFGHGEVKRTCFWTKNLPALLPTDIVEGREAKVHKMPPVLTAGRNAVAPMLALPTQWLTNGAITSSISPRSPLPPRGVRGQLPCLVLPPLLFLAPFMRSTMAKHDYPRAEGSMSKDDWQVGDLALCVRSATLHTNTTQQGCFYVVSGLVHTRNGLGLEFEGVENGAEYGPPFFWGHHPSRFRKIRPHEADEEDRETIRLLTEKRERVS